MGYLLLEGGAEFGGRMSEPDLRAIELAGGFEAPVRIIPTAAAPDRNHHRAGDNGLRWFRHLGAKDVAVLPVIDRASADEPTLAEGLRSAKLIYLLGGFTGYLGQTLKDSRVWEAALQAFRNGAVIAGSSAGAMVLCEFYYDPGTRQVVAGLNLVAQACVLPHHNSFGKDWAPRLAEKLPGVTLVGIDERTGMVDDGAGVAWSALGQGAVSLYRGERIERHPAGEKFSLLANQRETE
jgi:cyanophycinase